VYSSIALVLFVLLCIGGAAGCKEYNRYQKRADAQNAVKVTHIEIRRAEQQAQINRAQIEATKAEAEKRREEAKGIRDAQDTINATLTPLYVQHEAIQAQKAIATSGKNNTVIYVPAGTNGTPVVTAGAATGK
jgi:regulator of protease activity HflC (stomatin/prohibitin superfamily)